MRRKIALFFRLIKLQPRLGERAAGLAKLDLRADSARDETLCDVEDVLPLSDRPVRDVDQGVGVVEALVGAGERGR